MKKYTDLINSFIAGKISAQDFEVHFLGMFKQEEQTFPSDIYEVLNQLFSDVDQFCADENLRDDDDLDEEDLLRCAKEALNQLAVEAI